MLSHSQKINLRRTIAKLDTVEDEVDNISASIRLSSMAKEIEFEKLEEISFELFRQKQELRRFLSKYSEPEDD